MSFLWAKVEEQFQFHLKFLNLNVVVLMNYELLMTIEHVENNSSSMRIYLQKISFKEKVKHVI
jgi:hypothetical protein